jgi:uncharacterized protein DUF4082
MKKRVLLTVVLLACSAIRPPVFAAGLQVQDSPQVRTTETSSEPRSGAHYLPARGIKRNVGGEKLVPKATNLSFHGGSVIPSAHVVFIFWGPSFNNTASPDYNYALTLQNFRNQFGTTREYNIITEYSGSNGTIAMTNLAAGTADWFDTSTPPTNVTDAIAQSEVNAYLATHFFDASAIYEIVLPSTSYSSRPDGTTSCGGPVLSYCAYHGFFTSGGNAVKYSVEPYPSCGGCQVGGWTAVQNQEHFVTHETREAVTDPQFTGWYDASGNEADDKCAWSPTPFFGTGGYGYQYEWSNALSACAAGSLNIFTTQVPQDNLSTGGQVYTVATQWSSSQSGYVTQLGFYRAAGETGTNTLRLWTDDGTTQLASATASCSGPGWCWASIPKVAVTAGTRYRVSVNTNTFQSKTGCGIGSGIINQVLTAWQGFWIAGDTFPTTASCSNFFVDVKFYL